MTDPTPPRRSAVRWLVIAAVAVVVLVVLFTVVFPWLERNLSNPTLGAAGASGAVAAAVMPGGS